MKRRQLLGNMALSASAATAAACTNGAGPASSTGDGDATSSLPSVQWRMATSWPKSLETIFGGAQEVCDRVAAMTGGKFSITPYAAGEIVGGLEVFDAVQSGSVECGHTSGYYYTGKNKAFAFSTAVPFGLTAQQQNAWLYQGGGLDLMNEVYAQFGMLALPAGNTGAQMGGWFKNEINSLSDLQGLKMRLPGIGGDVMAGLGVNVQVLPGGEVYLALDRGAIDAAEWVGPADDEKLGLQNAASFYYYPGWWEPGATLDVQVNKAQWDRLPVEYQEIFKTATYQANANMLAKYEALNREALQRLVDGGTQLKAYSPEILKAAQEGSADLLNQFASQDAGFKKVFDQWSSFREQVSAWNAINELSYESFVAPEV